MQGRGSAAARRSVEHRRARRAPPPPRPFIRLPGVEPAQCTVEPEIERHRGQQHQRAAAAHRRDHGRNSRLADSIEQRLVSATVNRKACCSVMPNGPLGQVRLPCDEVSSGRRGQVRLSYVNVCPPPKFEPLQRGESASRGKSIVSQAG
jgi:hypothetical protein